jgi:hypothetical protein
MNKEAATKAKKVMREMLVYWKKNEKDELAARKRAEKEQLEKAKAEEEAREAKRQSRKLNFLLTQTELYSHFIGKKLKTHEAEGMDGGETPAAPLAPQGAELELDDNGDPLPELDYDEDDDENMRRHAARSAQEHMKAAKDKAAAFDQNRKANGEMDDAMDGDELNFQNPTMGENQITVTQPKMLMAQLKEYQLKGLTWLGNLYEQGINGILADEMGLGKTIQSISLLAYLAEVHGIWGPFLVIAPASTLHNWQQELARFVPRLKTIPYWGGPKDRETLRRIWNRKNQTFTEDSPFHIVVTSYQLAVQDEKYFHMMRWQYMILDEAQAIKSSSSARWKSLLSFNCRNRLLLTGTPIQNSMHGEPCAAVRADDRTLESAALHHAHAVRRHGELPGVVQRLQHDQRRRRRVAHGQLAPPSPPDPQALHAAPRQGARAKGARRKGRDRRHGRPEPAAARAVPRAAQARAHWRAHRAGQQLERLGQHQAPHEPRHAVPQGVQPPRPVRAPGRHVARGVWHVQPERQPRARGRPLLPALDPQPDRGVPAAACLGRGQT